MKKFRVTLEITVSDLPEDERKQLAEDAGWDKKDGDLPTLDDVEPREIADLIQADEPEMWSEFFAGSGIYAQVDSARVIEHSDWLS